MRNERSQPAVRPVPPETAFWVAFQHVPYIGPRRLRRLIETFGSLSTAWCANSSDLGRVLDERSRSSLVSFRTNYEPAREYDRITSDGIDVITLADAGYPALLREIPSPPPVLYIRGQLIETDRESVGVIGTRRVSPYGREMAKVIAAGLVEAGVTVVSGLARGVDGVAHDAALQSGGRTIAVLGSGLNRVYPYEHRKLAERIAAQGAVVSELAPDRKPDAPNFPARNRIISGLSLGIVVIEAPERSGALITVDFAADQGREVFAVPGNVVSPGSAGCLQVIRDGARMVRSAADILDDLHIRHDVSVDAVQSELPLDETARRLLAVLTGDPQHIDDIAERAGMAGPEVSAQLLTLELQDLVRNVGAQHYTRRR